MLRTSLRSARVLGVQPFGAIIGRQWAASASRPASLSAKRYYSDVKKSGTDASKQPVIPTSETQSSERSSPAAVDDGAKAATQAGIPKVPLSPSGNASSFAPATEDDVGQSSIHSSKISPLAGGRPKPTATEDDVGESSIHNKKIHPLAGGKPTPPASIDDVGESMAMQSEVPQMPPSSAPPAPKKKSLLRRLRNLLFTLTLLSALGFGGGVWYSRINDNFHDFFTEYVPYGEQAVLYLEEMEMKKRFPAAPTRPSTARQAGEQVRIPAQSGASWRVADGGRKSSANPASPKGTVPSSEEARRPSTPAPAEMAAMPVETAKPKTVETPKDMAKEVPKVASKPEPTASSPKEFKAPEVNEPSRFPPIEPIDLMKLADAKEPVVRDLVNMLNDLIVVINADGAHGKYSTSINKAKADIGKVGKQLNIMKEGVEKKAASEVRSRVEEFDKAAHELVARVEKAMLSQELEWRKEFEQEMTTVRQNYDERVKLLTEREKQLSEEKLQNQLLEQAVALKKDFVTEVKSRVEKERQGRLGQLKDLSSAVSELEKLTLGWNDVVDSNLRTQQLHVAVETVRTTLEESQHPRPFTQELVALKEIAGGDAVVDAAVASIKPVAYQRGIPSSSQLIDRFRRVASEVRKASLLPDEAGVASHASSWALSHVMFKKQGLAEGSDVESILTRAQTFLEEGDLDGAAREVNTLQGWAKTLSTDWLGEVRKVLEVQQALDVISTEARLQSLRVES